MKKPREFNWKDVNYESVAITVIVSVAKMLIENGVDRSVIAKGFEEAAKIMYASANVNKPT